MQVLVRDNNVDQALKALKKKMQREGIFREMKLRGHYEKPSEKKAREKAEAVRRARKLARKKMQREGLHSDEAEARAGRAGRRARRSRRTGPWRTGSQRWRRRFRRWRRLWRRRRFRALIQPASINSIVHGAGARNGPALWFFEDRALSSNLRRIPWVNSRGRDRPRRNPDRSSHDDDAAPRQRESPPYRRPAQPRHRTGRSGTDNSGAGRLPDRHRLADHRGRGQSARRLAGQHRLADGRRAKQSERSAGLQHARLGVRPGRPQRRGARRFQQGDQPRSELRARPTAIAG